MEAKMKHLEFIQSIINRMARNSFFLKGWSVTLVAAIFALSAKDSNATLVPVAYMPAIIFWFLDAYFLRQERLYRNLYDHVRQLNEHNIDFNLNATMYSTPKDSYFAVMFSITLRMFHGGLIVAIATINLITGGY